MPEGPLGGPRPASKAPLTIVFRLEEEMGMTNVMQVESALSTAAQEIGGATIPRGDLGKHGTTATIETDREQIFIEEVNRAVREFNKLSPIEVEETSINSD